MSIHLKTQYYKDVSSPKLIYRVNGQCSLSQLLADLVEIDELILESAWTCRRVTNIKERWRAILNDFHFQIG